MLRKYTVDFGFISHEGRPVTFLQPRHIPSSPNSLVTGAQCPSFPIRPLPEYPVGIEVSAPEVPVTAIVNLDLASIDILIQIRRDLSQSDFRSFDTRRIRGHPNTEVVLLESCSKVGYKRLGKLLTGTVELT